MKYRISCLCFDVRDEEELSAKLSRIENFSPCFHYWTNTRPPKLDERVVVAVARDHLSLLRELPIVAGLYREKRILVLVERLREKLAVLPRGENLWFVDRDCESELLCEKLRQLHAGCVERRERSIVLTRREMDVFQLLAAGMTSREICQSLSIRRSTLNTHKKHLFLKFKVSSSPQMVAASNRVVYQVG